MEAKAHPHIDNLLSPEALENPYPLFREIRETDPVHWNPLFQAWVLTRHKDILFVLQDTARFSSRRTPNLAVLNSFSVEQRQAFDKLLPYVTMFMQGMNEPEHTRQRAILQKSFTPRIIEHIRPRAQEIVNSLLDVAQSKKEFDFVQDFAYPLPATIILELIGIHAEAHVLVRNSSEAIARFLMSLLSGQYPPGLLEKLAVAIDTVEEYLLKLIQERRQNPQDDLLSLMLKAEVNSERLSEKELVVLCTMMLFAGHETTANLLSNGMLALMRNRDQWELLKSDPSLVAPAIEEMLRYDTSVVMVSRFLKEDVELDGKVLRTNQMVFTTFAAGNHDPALFSNPDTFDITRRPQRTLSFGHGIHYCIGSALAKLESQIAFSTLIQRMPDLQMVDNSYQRIPNVALRGLSSMKVTC